MELQYVKITPRPEKGKSIPCPHNEGVACERKDCYHCGWNPKLAEIRMEKIRKGVRI